MADASFACFVCDHCGKEVQSKKRSYVRGVLIHHMRDVHGESDSFVCDLCSREVNSKGNLTRHNRRMCDLCGVDYRDWTSLKHHEANVHKLIKFECDACGKVFGEKGNFTRHILAAVCASPLMDIRRFKCQMCEADFSNSTNLKHHEASIHHGITFQCDECGKLFGEKGNLTRHVLCVHQQRHPFECLVCGAKTRSSSDLKKHTIQHNSAHVQCDDCGRKFKEKFSLGNHFFAVHLKLHQFKCDQCPAEFTDSSALNCHKGRAHGRTEFICDLCSKSFKSKLEVAMHCIGRHMFHGITFQCDECGRVFGKKSNLIYHILSVHLQGRPFECLVCGAKFGTSADRMKHTVAQHNSTRVQCDHCGTRFRFKNVLAIHFFAVHLKLPRFRCDQCPAAFTHSSALIAHKGRAHGRAEFICDHCSKSFKHKCDFAVHYTATHMKLRSFKCSVCGHSFGRRSALLGHRKLHC